MLKISPLVILSAGLAGLLPLKSVSAQTFVPIQRGIDDFITPQNATAFGGAGSPNRLVGNSVNPTQTAIGVERDLFVVKTSGVQAQQVNVQINPLDENLLRMAIGQARGRVFVTWDGVDNAPGSSLTNLQVAYNGLGGIDFNIYDALEIGISFSDIGGQVHFKFWDGTDLSGNTFAQTTFDIPGGVEADPEAIPPVPTSIFAKNFNTTDFTVTGTASLTEILSRVGAIQMEIDSTVSPSSGWDMNIDIIRAVGQQEVPEPPSVPEPSSVISLLTVGAYLPV